MALAGFMLKIERDHTPELEQVNERYSHFHRHLNNKQKVDNYMLTVLNGTINEKLWLSKYLQHC